MCPRDNYPAETNPTLNGTICFIQDNLVEVENLITKIEDRIHGPSPRKDEAELIKSSIELGIFQKASMCNQRLAKLIERLNNLGQSL